MLPIVEKFPPREETEPLVLKVQGDRYRWTADKAAEGVSLAGQTVLVTGGTSGIGVPTVRALARTGARVVVTARNEAKGAQVVEEVSQAVAGAKVEVWALDLASLDSVRRFVGRAEAEGVTFNVVVNNAGLMAVPFALTADGIESQLQVNYVAPALLLKGLLDANRVAPGGRIVVVTSIAVKRLGLEATAYKLEGLNWADEAAYNKWLAYCYAKAAIVMHCNLLAKRLKAGGSDITVNCVHPGGIITGLQSALAMEEMQALGWFDKQGTVNPSFKTVDEGAATSVWAALSPEMAGRSGTYCENCRVTAEDDFGSNESPVHQARGTAAYLWQEENWEQLLAKAEEKLGEKLM